MMLRSYSVTSVFAVILFIMSNQSAFSQLPEEEVIRNVNMSGLTFMVLQKGNIRFHFQPSSFAANNANRLIEDSFIAIKDDSKLLDFKTADTLNIVFLNSTDQMNAIARMKGKGLALVEHGYALFVVNDSTRAYLKHELMHILSVKSFGNLNKTSYWMSEGLSVYAEGNCFSYSLDELGSYFMHEKLFLPIDTLETKFWDYPDMLTYMESGFVVRYLITNYGLIKFKQLWNAGFNSFNTVYGFTINELERKMRQYIFNKYKKPPTVDWQLLSEKGCG